MPECNCCCTATRVAAAAAVALLVVGIVLLARRNRHRRDGFAAAPEVYRAARELFERNAGATYSDYKAVVPGADPVQFTDVRGLWKGGRLTLAEVQKVV